MQHYPLNLKPKVEAIIIMDRLTKFRIRFQRESPLDLQPKKILVIAITCLDMSGFRSIYVIKAGMSRPVMSGKNFQRKLTPASAPSKDKSSPGGSVKATNFHS